MAEADWKYLQYNIETGQKRTSDGPSGGASSLADLDDTSISNPSDGQMLGYDGTEGKWKNVAAPAGSVTDVTLDGNTVVNEQGVAALTTPNVNDLKDTSISNLSNGQTLQYNATTRKWENTTPASGGNVDDVKVNGTSVVTNKVANITSYKEVTQAQYEALPDTKLSDGILYAIKDGGQAVDGFPPLIYSDEEREVGVWRDGKPLYQKNFWLSSRTSIKNDYTTILDSDITAYNIENIVSGCIYDNNGGTDLKRVRLLTGDISLIVSNNNQLIAWASSNNAYSATGYMIQYTKTTDTPGSGTWTTQGTIAHHYSTDEHIIGTWVDGKPIYEKSWEFDSYILISTNGITSLASKDVVLSDVNFFINAILISKVDKRVYNAFAVGYFSGSIGVYNPLNADAAIDKIILQYTKTTD